MAKRISAFFSSRDEESSRSAEPTQYDVPYAPSQTPPRSKLTKPMTKSPSDFNLTASVNTDLEPPSLLGYAGSSSRPSSRDGRLPFIADSRGSRQSSGSRPQTPTMLDPTNAYPQWNEGSPTTRKLNKRRSLLPGKSEKQPSASASVDSKYTSVQAWIAGLRELYPYDIEPLLAGRPVPDLWDEDADVLVYLFPQSSQRGPSFRVKSELFADSRVLSYLTQPVRANGYQQNMLPLANPTIGTSLEDEFNRALQSPFGSSRTSGPTGLMHTTAAQVKSVHLPLNLDQDYSSPASVPSGDDMELIVLYRNFFAFLCGGALVATPRQNTLFAIFMSISSILGRLEYGNDKGSSWGTIPWHSFLRYTEELRLADVRSSREKNIEAIVIGVAMRSWPLYVEGYVHAVGRLGDIKSIRSPKWGRLSDTIVTELEKASHDLQSRRLQVLHAKLDNFEFPSMFSGIANSQTATEAKLVRFKEWKAYFMDFRTYTMTLYKKRYGSWPPKASSKKNNFEESGLNRLLLREVYQDFTDLYDMLVDRTSLTPRTVDVSILGNNAESGSTETIQHALRSVESEYDRATPPVTPPIPFDVPLIPAFDRHMLARDAQNTRKLKDNDLNELLFKSYNRDAIKSSSWIQGFIEYERKLCHGKTIEDIIDMRCGQWLFVYAVLQALPMTVVDARDLNFTDGVEYFLCEAPRGGRPWVQNDVSMSRAWFNVASGGGLVSMPAEVIDHSVEGIYRRSHCWTIATEWAQSSRSTSLAGASYQATPVPPMQSMSQSYLAPASASARVTPAASPYASPLLQPVMSVADRGSNDLPRTSSRTSMQFGLEEVAPPATASRPVSNYNPNITFDNIIASKQIQQKGGKKGKK